MAKSFFRSMIEEKGLTNEVITTEVDGVLIIMEVERLVTYIEQSPLHEQNTIKDTFSKIDFYNGDLLHYLKFLTTCFGKEQVKSLNR